MSSLVDSNCGSKLFRWFNFWLDLSNCEGVVQKALEGFESHGPPDVVLMKKKFKKLKDIFRIWSKDNISKEQTEIEKLKCEKQDLDVIMEVRDLSEEELWVWLECSKRIEAI